MGVRQRRVAAGEGDYDVHVFSDPWNSLSPLFALVFAHDAAEAAAAAAAAPPLAAGLAETMAARGRPASSSCWGWGLHRVAER